MNPTLHSINAVVAAAVTHVELRFAAEFNI